MFEGTKTIAGKFEWLLDAMRTYDPLIIYEWPLSYDKQKLLDPRYQLQEDEDYAEDDILENICESD